MFYFFQRGAEFLQCEIRGDDTAGYEIVITEPKRPERRESFPTSDEAYKRWVELQDTLVSAGWWGPHGREPPLGERKWCKTRAQGHIPCAAVALAERVPFQHSLDAPISSEIDTLSPDPLAKRPDLEHSSLARRSPPTPSRSSNAVKSNI